MTTIRVAIAFFLPLLLSAAEEPRTKAGRDQLDTERHAMRLVARRELQQELVSLEARWKQKSPQLLPSTLSQIHASLEELLFLVATETIDSDPRRPRVVQISAPPHTWFGARVPGARWGIDNPDTQYFIVPLEAASSYILTGRRRAPGPVDSNFSYGTQDVWGTISNIGHDELRVDANGTYRITLDNKPANGRPNHIQLTAAGDTLFIRNTLSDWATQNVDSIEVERTAGPPPEAQPDDDALARTVITRIRTVLEHLIGNLQAPVFRVPVNVLPQPGKPGEKAGFLVTQRNALGHFHLGADDAMIATLHPGGARYATFPVTNVWGVSTAYWSHQTSLNNRQAAANPDGTITVVLSARDPGVANWVDTCGLEEGFVMLRWQGLPKQAGVDSPKVEARVVKLADLAAALPAGTKRVTPAERKAQLARRQAGFARRFADRWQ